MNMITTGKAPIGVVSGIRDAACVKEPRKVGEVLHATGELEDTIARVQLLLDALNDRLSPVLEAEPPCAMQGTDTPEATCELGRRLRVVWTRLVGAEQYINRITDRVSL